MILPEQGQQTNYLEGIFKEGYKDVGGEQRASIVGFICIVGKYRYFTILTIKYDNLLGILNGRLEVNFRFTPEYLVAAFGPDDIA